LRGGEIEAKKVVNLHFEEDSLAESMEITKMETTKVFAVQSPAVALGRYGIQRNFSSPT
jgi:hypothetical protein